MIAVPAAVTTRTRESSCALADGGSIVSEAWSSLHHSAALLSLGDAELVACAVGAHAAAPDPEAFGVLYERYVNRIFAFAVSRLHDRAQAEDVTSQTFLQALQALPRYQQRGIPIRYWLFTIAANAMHGLHRASPGTPARLGETNEQEGDARGSAPVLELPDPDAEAAIAAGEWAEDFRHLLNTLSPAQRTVIRLRFSGGLGIAVIAARMGRTEGAVKALQFRGVQELRRRWDEETAADPDAAVPVSARSPRGTAAGRTSSSPAATATQGVRHGSPSASATPSQPNDACLALMPSPVTGGTYCAVPDRTAPTASTVVDQSVCQTVTSHAMAQACAGIE